ncbi:capZ-interacting protein isoform X1 [Scomber japonicus]|uniref:capZ-interacting protein isoform X1 n=1 Tax=Scomber japonicus TaxID=13676 RepID=UPI0023062B99|nr:capZ-interacting protein isoform X1 [Scomber japonicus]
MEKDPPSKPSVAELAGRFKGHIIPTPTSNDESPFYGRPPSSLKLQNHKDDNEESDKTNASSKPLKMKMKSSPIIEKLQANLALSPTALLPSPKTSEVKLQPAPLSPTTPCSPKSPLGPTLRPQQQSFEEEDPVSFDSPPEGAPLPSFNKTRARLSFKRRPPTRQHRRSAGEEAGAFGSGLSPSELYSPKENGDEDLVLDSPAEEAEHGQAEVRDRDCEKEDVAKDDPDNREDLEEQAAEAQALTSERQPSEPCPAEQTEGDFQREENQEEMPRPTKEEIKGCEL